MKTTILSEARDGRVTITVSMPFKEASMLLDVVTDSVLLGNTKGDVQEWAEQLMRDLDDHLQRNEGSNDANAFIVVNTAKDRSPVHRCPYCGFYGVDGKQCRNCGEGA